jgi:hypothetical protein
MQLPLVHAPLRSQSSEVEHAHATERRYNHSIGSTARLFARVAQFVCVKYVTLDVNSIVKRDRA